MTEQQPGGVPEDFDAFSRPAGPDDTWVSTTPAYYTPIDPYGTEDPDGAPPAPGRPPGLRSRLAGLGRGRLIAGGVAALLVLGGVAWGASAALGSSGGSSAASAASSTVSPPAAAPGAKGKGTRKTGLKVVRLKITSVSADSFVGTDAKGASVTVAFGDSTHFGTKAKPLSPDQLAVGMVVSVAGDRTGGSVDATAIVPAAKAAGAGAGATDAPSGAAGASGGSVDGGVEPSDAATSAVNG